jgi:hypothetical protein
MEARLLGFVFDGSNRRRPWRGGEVCSRHSDLGPIWRPFSPRHFGYQRYRFIPYRDSNDAPDRAVAPAPVLAASLGRGLPRRLYDVLQLRIRNAPCGTGWRQMDRSTERHWKCHAGLYRCMDRDRHHAAEMMSGANASPLWRSHQVKEF